MMDQDKKKEDGLMTTTMSEKEREEKERAENLKLMKSPDKWLCWPILPVKRVIVKTEMPAIGFMLATGEPVVYLKNMYDLKGGSSVKDIMENTPSKRYENFEEILNDGWLAD